MTPGLHAIWLAADILSPRQPAYDGFRFDDPIRPGAYGDVTGFWSDDGAHFSIEAHGVSPEAAIEIMNVLRRDAERRTPRDEDKQASAAEERHHAHP